MRSLHNSGYRGEDTDFDLWLADTSTWQPPHLKVSIWAFAIIVAVNQLGIATTLVNTMVMATFGAVALALGLAFGLGGRDTAAELVAEWRQAAKDAEPKVKAAAESMQNTSTPRAASSIDMAPSVSPKTRPS